MFKKGKAGKMSKRTKQQLFLFQNDVYTLQIGKISVNTTIQDKRSTSMTNICPDPEYHELPETVMSTETVDAEYCRYYRC